MTRLVIRGDGWDVLAEIGVEARAAARMLRSLGLVATVHQGEVWVNAKAGKVPEWIMRRST